ncbi:peptide ABC transporter substrate-binding protein [Halomonas salifodinae]|uniref:peptide ABC transporter substrate-binding protein n=1 Tax=Halomonas salifodinae TaxID=438745 RepID=UPI0033A402AB
MLQSRTLLGSLALTLGLAAAPLHADTLRIAIMGEPASLDPHKISGTWENDVVGDLFEGLITEAADGERIPGVAESWEISEDGTVYTFHLRESARWSDGTSLTADDFVFALRRILNPATAADYAYLLYPIRHAEAVYSGEMAPESLGVEALDDQTLRITLERATPYFLDQLSHYTAYPVPRHVVEEHGDRWSRAGTLVSNGPFTLQRWQSQTRIEAVRNPHYHDAESVALDEVIYFPIEERNTALNRFRAGEIDVARDFPTQQYSWLRENLPEATHTAPYLGIYYYALNARDGHPTADPRVREALSLAVRREVITEQILGTGEAPAYHFVPPGANHHQSLASPLNGLDEEARLARAGELMREAGYGPDNPLSLKLRYNTSEDHRTVAIAIAAMWRPLGVEVELFNSEVAVHYADLRRGDFDVGRAGWIGDYNDPQNFLSLLESGVANNYGAYSQADFDALMAQAAETQDLTARAALMGEAEALALGDSAVLPIYYYVSRNLVNPALAGWENNLEDIHRSRWVSFEE